MTVLDKPATYRIKVRGSVPESWLDRLGGMRVVAISSTQTTLEGLLPDQAALKGVLDTLYELRLQLEEVTCLENPKFAAHGYDVGQSSAPKKHSSL